MYADAWKESDYPELTEE